MENKKMIQLNDRIVTNENLFIMKGNVKIYEDDKLILDKDNVITKTLRQLIMYELFQKSKEKVSHLNTITSNNEAGVENIFGGYINEIRFGRGTSAVLGAKASKDDIALVSPIPNKVHNSNEDLYINSTINRDLQVHFDFDDLNIVFTSELINNDSITYVLGELGIFYETSAGSQAMLTHLFFDPIFFEPNTTKKIVYTIYLY